MSRTTPQPVHTGESARQQLLAGLDITEQTIDLAGIRTAVVEAGDGPPLVLLHVDPNWYRTDWADVAVGIEAVADDRDVPFGILYNGGTETDGATWMNFMMANAAELEIEHGASPQHVSIQSWVDWPDHALPEDDLTALTSGILRYFGERRELSIARDDDAIDVAVLDTNGNGIPDVSLDVSRVASGGGVATKTVTGTVPEDIGQALVLIRANAEDATKGTVGAILQEVTFTDGIGGPNLVPNSDFASGVQNWGVYGSNPRGVQPVAAGSGRGLSLEASENQDIFIDGTIFPVTGGSEYELAVTYELAGAPNSVVVSVAFVGVSRANILLDDVPDHWPVSGVFDME